ncbi:hypothetical protein AFLA_009295 [Aspergillus flavus NRRL3357]|nr:hypothetical protein AFLA_009295 [Aspergillus flavus NRRL3357]
MVGSPSEREPRKQDQRVWKRLRRADSASVPHMRGGGITPPCPMIRAAVEGLSPPTNSPSRLPLHIRIPPPSPPTTFFLLSLFVRIIPLRDQP